MRDDEDDAVVALFFDGGRVGSDVAGPTGKFNTRFTVPAAARPGDHIVEAVGQSSGVSARAIFLVRTDWLQRCFDGGRGCFNPYENVLGRGNAGALAVRWRASIGTDGGSSPVYANGKLFVGTADGLVGLDPASGAIIIHVRSGPVSTTPAVIRGFDPQPDPPGKVIFGSSDGILHAVSTSGAELWQVGLGAVPNSPLVPPCFPPDPCKVIVGAGDTLFAFDGNGTRLWAAVLAGGPISKAAAVMVEPPNPDHVIVAAGNTLYALDAASGQVIWATAPSRSPLGAPRSATRGDPSRSEPWVVLGDGGGNIYAFDTVDAFPAPVWQAALGGPVDGPPVLANGILYVATDPQLYAPCLFALDQASGRVLFMARLPGGVAASPIVADGRLVVATKSGDVVGY